ncbi:MAG: FG-GAP-like repeat-containing protein [Terriglobales bacterium]
MKSFRLSGPLLVFFLLALMMVFATAQSTPSTHANQFAQSNQPATTRDAQSSPAAAQVAPAAPTETAKFASAVTYPSGGYIGGAPGSNYSPQLSVAVADLNGDGKPDLVVTNQCLASECDFTSDGEVSVLLGNGDGTFQTAVSYDTGGIDSVSVAIKDVNGDGVPDLVVANQCLSPGTCSISSEGGVSVLLGNGDGTFKPAVAYDSGGVGATSVAIGDLNGDGFPDLAVTNEGCAAGYCPPAGAPAVVSILLGNGDGTFQTAVTYDTGAYGALSVAIADLNADGHLDLAVANEFDTNPADGNGTGAVSILLGNGDGTFQAAQVSVTAVSIVSIAIADLNGDGKLDLVAAAPSFAPSNNNSGGAYAILGNGDGTFQAPLAYASDNSSPTSAAVADVNGDGIPDIVVASECWSYQCVRGGGLEALLGYGDGTFQAGLTLPLTLSFHSGGPDAVSVAVADLNGDGRPDLVAANTGYIYHIANVPSTVGVLLNDLLVQTTTKVTSSLSPSSINQSVTFTATITAKGAAVPNGSTVTFYNGASEIGTGTTTNGVASLTTSFAAAGKYTIKASYAGDAFHEASSGKVTQVVNTFSSTTTLSSSPNPSTSGQAVTLTATVTSGATGGPTGTVTFKNGTKSLGMANLSGGTATLTTTRLPVGTLTLTADYSGDTQSAKSSGTTTQTVN